MERRIYVENDYDGLYTPFWQALGTPMSKTEFLQDPQRAHLVCFTGGEDVGPEYYGHNNLGSYNNVRRDEEEVRIFQLAYEHGIPMTGICRGSQFLNVMCGGTMVQHMRHDHGGSHHIAQCLDGASFKVTSSHHQMSVLGDDGVCLSWSEKTIPTAACIYDGDLIRERLEPDLRWAESGRNNLHVTEAFAYPQDNVFAVQHHPEWQRVEEPARDWTLNKIREICWGEVNSAKVS